MFYDYIFAVLIMVRDNLNVSDFKTRFEDRLVDRFKSFNVIVLNGKSRRK